MVANSKRDQIIQLFSSHTKKNNNKKQKSTNKNILVLFFGVKIGQRNRWPWRVVSIEGLKTGDRLRVYWIEWTYDDWVYWNLLFPLSNSCVLQMARFIESNPVRVRVSCTQVPTYMCTQSKRVSMIFFFLGKRILFSLHSFAFHILFFNWVKCNFLFSVYIIIY